MRPRMRERNPCFSSQQVSAAPQQPPAGAAPQQPPAGAPIRGAPWGAPAGAPYGTPAVVPYGALMVSAGGDGGAFWSGVSAPTQHADATSRNAAFTVFPPMV